MKNRKEVTLVSALPRLPMIQYATASVLLSVGTLAFSGIVSAQTSGTIIKENTFPTLRLGMFQNGYLSGSMPNDLGFNLGGVGSGLWHSRQHDADDTYWMVTDRGPQVNYVDPVTKVTTSTFPLPTFTPFILNVRSNQDGTVSILSAMPLVKGPLAGTTGLPNLAGSSPLGDENGFSLVPGINSLGLAACIPGAAITKNQSGLDTEDLVQTTDGNFWLVDEYSTSIVKVGASGNVLKRFVPVGVSLPNAGYPVSSVLPAAYVRRTRNRGFEGIALSPDDKTLFAALQSPLTNGNLTFPNNFFNTRILAFNMSKELPSGEWVYVFDPIRTFTSEAETNQSLMKISAIAAIDEHNLLVLERTDFVAKIYRVDTRQATDILGSLYDTVNPSPSLESFDSAGLAAAGIVPLAKQLVINLESISGMPDKIEGLTIIDKNTIAISNDNDFQVGSFDPLTCNNRPTTTESKILVIRLEQSLW